MGTKKRASTSSRHREELQGSIWTQLATYFGYGELSTFHCQRLTHSAAVSITCYFKSYHHINHVLQWM
jgi:hypothetical protein